MTTEIDPRIKAALQVSKQIYALSIRDIPQEEFNRLAEFACDIFELNRNEDLQTVAMIAVGMLEFATHVEKISGMESINKLLAASTQDPEIYEALNAGTTAALVAMAERIKASGNKN